MFRLIFLWLALGLAENLVASCCSSGSVQGVGRLLAYERAMIEQSHDARLSFGSFDRNAQFKVGQPDHLPHWQLNHEWQIMARIANWLQPFIRLPIRTQISRIRASSSFADMSLGFRSEILTEHFIKHAPALCTIIGWQLPTGVVYQAGKDINIESITGLGTSLLNIGLVAERNFGAWQVALAYALGLEPRMLRASGFANGPIHRTSFSVGHPVHDNGMLTFSSTFMISQAARLNQEAIRNSHKQKFSLGLSYQIRLHSHVSLSLGAGTDIPISFLERNVSNETYVRLGMRVGVF